MIINKETNYYEIIAEEGKRLTIWHEGDDIKEYSSFSKGVFPLVYDIDIIREITEEEDADLNAQKEAAEQEEEPEAE